MSEELTEFSGLATAMKNTVLYISSVLTSLRMNLSLARCWGFCFDPLFLEKGERKGGKEGEKEGEKGRKRVEKEEG